METQSTYNKFGKKMKRLIKVTNDTENWKDFVEPKTVELIQDLFVMQNITDIMLKHDISYNNLRAKYLIALDRITDKNSNGIRKGKSTKAIKLFKLVETTDNWESVLTDREIQYVNEFKKIKNFYEVGRKLGVSPSNIAGTLYGTNQRKGVTSKIEELHESMKINL